MSDGGSAFPTPYSPGMSLREWFAGQALRRFITAEIIEKIAVEHDKDWFELTAMMSYGVADAMIAERNK